MSDRVERLTVQYILGENEFEIYDIVKEDFANRKSRSKKVNIGKDSFVSQMKHYVLDTYGSVCNTDSIEYLFEKFKSYEWDGIWVNCFNIANSMLKDNKDIKDITKTIQNLPSPPADCFESIDMLITYFTEKITALKIAEVYNQVLCICELKTEPFDTLNFVLKKEQENIACMEQNLSEIYNKVCEYLHYKETVNALNSRLSNTQNKYLAAARLKTLQQKKAIAECEEKRMQKKSLESIVSTKETIEDTPTRIHLLPLFVAVVLFVSVFDLPYSYYTFARIVIFGTMIWHTLVIMMMNDGIFSAWQVPTALMAIMWNPILPIYLDKDSWVALDIIGIVICIAEAIYSYRLAKKQ